MVDCTHCFHVNTQESGKSMQKSISVTRVLAREPKEMNNVLQVSMQPESKPVVMGENETSSIHQNPTISVCRVNHTYNACLTVPNAARHKMNVGDSALVQC